MYAYNLSLILCGEEINNNNKVLIYDDFRQLIFNFLSLKEIAIFCGVNKLNNINRNIDHIQDVCLDIT